MKPKCSIIDCPNESNSKGWCKPHYDAWIRKGDPLTYKGDQGHLSVWEKVQLIGWTRTPSGCLEYNGSRNDLGYGTFRDISINKSVRVHRLVYANLIGIIGDDEKVLHKCDNPPCGEPNHLRKGSQADNLADMRAKGRDYRPIACPNGHPYTTETLRNKSKNRCRQCARDRNRRYHARKKEQPSWAGV